VLGGTVPADRFAYRPFTVAWGDRPGTLRYQPAAPDSNREYSGPTSVRIGPGGDLFVMNTLAASVDRFTPNGSFVRSYRYPAATKHDAVTVGLDVAFGPGGELYVLELALRVLFEIGTDGPLKQKIRIPLQEGAPSVLNGVDVDDRGRLLVFDGFDNRIVRFDRFGKLIDQAVGELAQGLVGDGAGRMLVAQLATPDGSSRIRLLRADPFGSTAEPITELVLKEPAVEVHPLGVDRAGRVYVEVAFGAVEKPTGRKVLVLSGGKVIDTLPVGEPPSDLRMVRWRAVVPEGGLVTVQATSSGLRIEPRPLSR
jgi:sugar lactone lactonase YvrE